MAEASFSYKERQPLLIPQVQGRRWLNRPGNEQRLDGIIAQEVLSWRRRDKDRNDHHRWASVAGNPNIH